MLIDVDGYVVSWNKNALPFLGCTDAVDVGTKSFFEMFDANTNSTLKTELERTILDGVPSRFELQLQTETYGKKWVLIEGTHFNWKGKTNGSLISFVDLSEQRFGSFLKSFHSSIMALIAQRVKDEDILQHMEKEVYNYDSDFGVEITSSAKSEAETFNLKTVKIFSNYTSEAATSRATQVTEIANQLLTLSHRIRITEEELEVQREKLKARMEAELQMAKTVQETLFPPSFKDYDFVKIAGHYEPATECGGDWWYYTSANDKIIFCIGDATGHGAPAALITSAARSAASILENFSLKPHEIIRFINKAIYDVSKGRVTMTFFLGVLDTKTSVLTYCNASHEPPFLVKGSLANPSKKDLIPLMEVNNTCLGQNRATVYDQAQITLEADDFILFYTDGIADIRNVEGASLGERGFLKVALQSMQHRAQPQVFVQNMTTLLNDYRDNAGLVDDITFFCLKFGSESPAHSLQA